jgi:hypothetical protein
MCIQMDLMKENNERNVYDRSVFKICENIREKLGITFHYSI